MPCRSGGFCEGVSWHHEEGGGDEDGVQTPSLVLTVFSHPCYYIMSHVFCYIIVPLLSGCPKSFAYVRYV